GRRASAGVGDFGAHRGGGSHGPPLYCGRRAPRGGAIPSGVDPHDGGRGPHREFPRHDACPPPRSGDALNQEDGGIHEATRKIVDGCSLRVEEARAVMESVMTGEATPAQIAGFLVALRMKGETVEEIAGCAAAMRAHCLAIPIDAEGLVDTCGTGGDGAA